MTINKFLFEFSGKCKNNLWLGIYSPINSATCNLFHSTNFRAAPNLHHKFDCVWIYEEAISNFLGWKIIIDESIRFLKEEGCLVVRLNENNFINIVSIKSFLNSNINISAEVYWEDYRPKDKQFLTIIFKIKRKNFNSYLDKKWSFAVLTQGNRVENVVKLAQSIRKLDSENKHQIIVSGPKNERYESFDVIYNEKIYSDVYAEISKKKNDLITMAKNSNLIIFHDRYVLDENFFSGFEKYGYDFDFVTVKQFYEDGVEFPSYCATSKEDFAWCEPIKCDDYSILSNEQYINGGLMIFKKHCVESVGFNPMLFWNQQEDVELSKRLAVNGIIPRINFFSSCTAIGINSTYTAAFKKEDKNLLIMKMSEALVSASFKYKRYPIFSTLINSFRKVLKTKKAIKLFKKTIA